MQVNKPKSASKVMIPPSKKLDATVLDTLREIATLVGATLGPGGKQVLIERPEIGMKPIVTKDGVTVIKHLGFRSAVKQLILEAARDASIRTAQEAGDGPQPLYAKVLTPRGFVKMKDIKVGMDICGMGGTTQKVLGVYPKGQKEIFKVCVLDGRDVECSADHLWEVNSESWAKKKIKTTEQISQDFVKKTKSGELRYKYYLPQVKVDFTEEGELPLDPYLLGVLLGDGSLSDSGSVEISLGLSKKHIIDRLVLPDGVSKAVQFVEKRNSYRVKLKGLRRFIQLLKIDNTNSFTKFIPKQYLYSSVKTREMLLQGLLDTDGHINKRGLFEFSTVSDNMLRDFLELVRGLGRATNYKLHTRENDPDSYSENAIHRVCELKGYKLGAKIVDVKKTGKFTEMQCIKVSNPDNLYITDNYIPTHNTTTATILSYAIADKMQQAVEHNPKVSPQMIIREMVAFFPEIEKIIKQYAIRADDESTLRKVAKLSANGDDVLANAVLDALSVVGDEGNMTIVENIGPHGYKIERMHGYALEQGYENSCRNLGHGFINDKTGTKIQLETPLVLLFDGVVNDISQVMHSFQKINDHIEENGLGKIDVLLVAHGFSDAVVGDLHLNFNHAMTKVKVVPLLTPESFVKNSRTGYLHDLQAYVCVPVYNPIDKPIVEIDVAAVLKNCSAQSVEIDRFKATVIATEDDESINLRVEELKERAKSPESEYETHELNLRIGKLTSGIARLEISAPSAGETREKRDRAEDAWMAVKGAVKHGAVPGGGYILLKIAAAIGELKSSVASRSLAFKVYQESLIVPFVKLYENFGYKESEILAIMGEILSSDGKTFDINQEKLVNGDELLDSVPAVLEAIRNSLSIASLLGSLGGIVCFERDYDADKAEEKFVRRFEESGGLRD